MYFNPLHSHSNETDLFTTLKPLLLFLELFLKLATSIMIVIIPLIITVRIFCFIIFENVESTETLFGMKWNRIELRMDVVKAAVKLWQFGIYLAMFSPFELFSFSRVAHLTVVSWFPLFFSRTKFQQNSMKWKVSSLWTIESFAQEERSCHMENHAWNIMEQRNELLDSQIKRNVLNCITL